MIEIIIQNEKVTLPEKLSFNIDIHNALFSNNEIEGDVMYSFDLPVEGNERILSFVHLPQCSSRKSYECAVKIDGVVHFRGKMILQKSSDTKISAAVIINPYPESFADRSLKENNSDYYTIATTPSTHNGAWRAFIREMAANNNVKFAPFFNAEAYGSNNEDYGFWKGVARDKVVNAIVYDSDGNIINSITPFSQAENKMFDLTKDDGLDAEGEPVVSQYIERNQLCFAPQIRLSHILQIFCNNAGYEFVNHLGEELDNIFVQGVKALDATMAQYENMEDDFRIVTTASEVIDNSWMYCNSFWLDGQSQDLYVHNGKVWLPSSGWWLFSIESEFTHVAEYNPNNPFASVPDYWVDLYIYSGTHTVEELDAGQVVPVFKKRIRMGSETKAAAIEKAVYIPENFTNVGLKFLYVRKKKNQDKKVAVEGSVNDITVRRLGQDPQQCGFNIFRKGFTVAECCPDITNADFIKTCLAALGLCYFVSGTTRRIEVVPYSHIKQFAKSLDLTEYVIHPETEVKHQENTLQKFILKPMQNQTVEENLRLPDTEEILPDPYIFHGKIIFRRNTNTFYRAEKVEAEEGNGWSEEWTEYSGNNIPLEIGDKNAKVKNVEPSVVVPHLRETSFTEINSGRKIMYAVCDFELESDIYNLEKSTQMILTYHRGLRDVKYDKLGEDPECVTEVMCPSLEGEFSIKTSGENSLGELYVAPVLELNSHREISYKMRLPINKLQMVEELLRPNVNSVEYQTRFIVVDNVKSIPKSIQFQIDNNTSDVLCQIDAVTVY